MTTLQSRLSTARDRLGVPALAAGHSLLHIGAADDVRTGTPDLDVGCDQLGQFFDGPVSNTLR